MDEIQDIYTNSVRIEAGIYEFALEFALNTRDEEGQMTRQIVARVRMSPQHALSLNILLTKFLDRFQEQFQEIYLPEELLQRLMAE